MNEILELIREIDQDNVGLLLDSWHWYTSYGTLDDIRNLRSKGVEVIYVHMNDAPAGIPVDEQMDFVREVPGETGVIDLVGFLKGLKEVGYDGPVTPSTPGSKILKGMSLQEAAQVCYAALVKLWRLAGLDNF